MLYTESPQLTNGRLATIQSTDGPTWEYLQPEFETLFRVPCSHLRHSSAKLHLWLLAVPYNHATAFYNSIFF